MRRVVLAVVVALTLLAGACSGSGERAETPPAVSDEPVSSSTTTQDAGAAAVPTPSTEPAGPPPLVAPSSVGRPWGEEVRGLLTFRGNPTRTYYGADAPRDPQERWRFPDDAMCSLSRDRGEVDEWCGTGWTGQPAVVERGGRTWVVFGAYDGALHFVDAATGERILPDLPTGDLVKGSVTFDPNGFPLVYFGSRDGYLRVVAVDRPAPEVLWQLHANDVSPTLWNDDWDGAPLVLDDLLIEGGENSRLHVVRLNRAYDDAGRVVVAPELVADVAGWDDELLAAVGDTEVSIESSVSVVGDVAFFANSGGLVSGFDLGPVLRSQGPPTRVFRFWTGDDTDASVVVDELGALYVASEYERETERARAVGQVVKLDPWHPDDPLVWSFADELALPSGSWSTPALFRDLVVATMRNGRVLALDRDDGSVRWELSLPGPLLGSPVVVDDLLLQGDCAGTLHAFDVSDPAREPAEVWSAELGGCVESTPAVWGGGVYVGSRAGFVHALADAG